MFYACINILLSATIFISQIPAFHCTKIEIYEVKPCNPNFDYPVKINVKFTTLKNGDQSVNISLSFRIPTASNDQILMATMSYSRDGKKFMRLMSLKRSEPCDYLNNDLRTFWNDFRKLLKPTPKRCPIPPGDYGFVNYKLPFNKFVQLQYPSGFVSSLLTLKDKHSEEILMCNDYIFKMS